MQANYQAIVPFYEDVLYINVYGAYIEHTGAAVVICIIPDKRWATKINWMMCSVPHCRDVEEAEAAACLEGMLSQLVTISISLLKNIFKCRLILIKR